MTTDLFNVSIVDNDVSKALDKLFALLSPGGMMFFLGSTMGPYLAKRAGERFRDEGDDASGPWAPLKEATIAIREAQGFGAGPINRRTGELERWVVGSGWNAYPTGFGASMQFPKSRPGGELGRKVETAQKGRKIPPKTVARPVLAVGETDLIFFQSALAFAVQEALE